MWHIGSLIFCSPEWYKGCSRKRKKYILKIMHNLYPERGTRARRGALVMLLL